MLTIAPRDALSRGDGSWTSGVRVRRIGRRIWRRACGLVATESFHEVVKHLRQLASHDGEVDVELLVFVDLTTVRGVFGHLKELDSLDVQLFREHEGDPAIPGQAEACRVFAGGEMRLDLFPVQGMPDVTY